ncbi:SDR family NAD(P)-dependent oxidoreductase [Ligilactobacillus pobuzihii]|uniref:SDR family oxidoreductase n=1 Tax=Ligilactobacillus pobuzihii TaxID=449659 RepID=UPI0019D171BF|nr:SDR family oxidoreductase [Ligilactobacillus pobuzihii]MBN7275011.1 SDR family NAD(P)-dependent oxidoreductase [Ligilactobacillus pobuzihii]
MAIDGKVVVITGASSGIGATTAKLLAKNGAKVVLGARREEKLATLVSEIEIAGGTAVYQVTDVTKPADSQRLVQLAKDEFGKVDVIFLNAGIMPVSMLSSLRTDEWNQAIDVNIKGVLNGIAAILPTFNEQKSGQVIATSSVAGIKTAPGSAVYSATKFAVKAIMESLRMESATAGTNIRTTTLYPGLINTELIDSVKDPTLKQASQEQYDKLGISPESIAETVKFAVDQPEDTNVSELTIYPTKQA